MASFKCCSVGSAESNVTADVCDSLLLHEIGYARCNGSSTRGSTSMRCVTGGQLYHHIPPSSAVQNMLHNTSPWLLCFCCPFALPLQGNKTGQVLAGGIVRTERELHKLMTVIAERYKDRQGGYTRIVQLGRRQHDAAPMAYIE
jgi:hypothetical protein